MPEAFEPGEWAHLPMGDSPFASSKHGWSVQVLRLSDDGRFALVGNNGVLKRSGKWVEVAKLRKIPGREVAPAGAEE